MNLIQTQPEALPARLLGLLLYQPERDLSYRTSEEALAYLRNEVRPRMEEMIVVALWGEFEVLLLDKSLPPSIQRKARELFDCMKRGKPTEILHRFFPHVPNDMLSSICERGAKLWDFRSWIAHGRSPYEAPERWIPEEAYEFLKSTLTIFDSDEDRGVHRP